MNKNQLKPLLEKIRKNEEYSKILGENIITENESDILKRLEEVVSFTKENNLNIGYNWGILNLGKYYGRIGELDKSDKYIREAFVYFEDSHKEGELSAMLGFMGNAFARKDYKSVLEWGIKGIVKSEEYKSIQRLWLFKTNMVALFITLEEYEKALVQLIEMERIPLVAKEQGVVINSINKCICEIELKKYKEALVSITKGENIARKAVKNYLPKVLIEKGRALMMLGRIEEGIEIIKDILEIEDGQINYRIEGEIYLAEAHIKLKEYNRALQLLESTLTFIDKNLEVYLKYIYKNLSDTFKGLEDYYKAYEYLVKYNEIIKMEARVKDSNLIGTLSNHTKIDEEKNYKLLYNENEKILNLGQKITSNLNKKVIFDIVAKDIKNIINYDVIHIAQYCGESNSFTFLLRMEKGKFLRKISIPLSEPTLTGYCIKHKCEIFINDLESEYTNYIEDLDRYSTIYQQLYDGDKPRNCTNSIITVPLIINDEIIGVLSLQSYEKDVYKIKDIMTLNLLATYIGIAFENARLYKTVRYQANYDVLTGIANRRSVMNSIYDFYNKEDINKEGFYIAMVDIDNFKKINDKYGHLYGDSVLVKVATILKKALKKEEVVGRYGGEEFILMINDSYDNVLNRLEDIRRSVERESTHITISIGVTKISESKPEETISYADKALYDSKITGKNKVTFFNI